MFTLVQIEEAHSQVKSGADFSNYIRDIKRLGVVRFDHFVSDGHMHYAGENNDEILSEAAYDLLRTAHTSSIKSLKEALNIHQKGETDYLTFCRQSAEAGVEKWTADLTKMTCIYYDLKGDEMILEYIPEAK